MRRGHFGLSYDRQKSYIGMGATSYLYNKKPKEVYTMLKKIIGLGIALAMIFSLVACIPDSGLDDYKATAKAELTTYANAKGECNYCEDNWSAILGLVNTGKAAVDAAIDKPAVNSAVEKAKQLIDEVAPKEGDEMLKQGFYVTDDGIGRIKLYGDNLFTIIIVHISHVPTGSYAIISGKLVFYLSDFELIFDIESDRIIFRSAYLEGSEHDFFIQPGTTFKLSEEIEIFEVETEDMIELYIVPTSSVPTIFAFLLKYADENATFICATNEGNFFLADGYVGKNVKGFSGEIISWRAVEKDSDEKFEMLQIEKVFADVILKVDDNIIGYAVMEFLMIGGMHTHKGNIIKSAIFPKIGGEYQNVTETQVKSIIEKIKGDATL